MTSKSILIISPEAWGVNFVSKHHYANYLAKENKVYFLNPVNKSKINPFGKIELEQTRINENLVILTYQNLLPKLADLPLFLQKWIYKKQANQIQDNLNRKFDIVWSFDPNRYYNQRVWNANKTIGHVVDYFSDNELLHYFYSSSDLNIVVSKYLKNPNYNNMYVIGHGFDDEFKQDLDEIELPGSNKLKAIYLGNVFGILDFNRLSYLANNYKEIDFILIGPAKKSNLSENKELSDEIELADSDNIFLIGEVNSQNIHQYLIKGDINLLMIKDRKNIPNLNSHKLMSYFYSGNITISDALYDYSNFEKYFFVQCENSESYNLNFKEVVDNIKNYNNRQLMDDRINFALKNSYRKKVDEILKLLY